MNYWTNPSTETEEYTAKDAQRFLKAAFPFFIARLHHIPIENIPIMWASSSTMESYGTARRR